MADAENKKERGGWLDRMKDALDSPESWPPMPDFPPGPSDNPLTKERPASGEWDYKTVVLTGGFMGRHKEELDRRAFEKHLDELGGQGFELVWVLLEQALQGEKDGHLLIFKRKL